jgi:hypothetical protein
MAELEYPEYVEKLTRAAEELEAAEAGLWEEARREGQADPRIPLIVRPGSPLVAAVDRVLLARSAVTEAMREAPPLER